MNFALSVVIARSVAQQRLVRYFQLCLWGVSPTPSHDEQPPCLLLSAPGHPALLFPVSSGPGVRFSLGYITEAFLAVYQEVRDNNKLPEEAPVLLKEGFMDKQTERY